MIEKFAQVHITSIFNSPFGRGYGFGDFVSIVLSNAVIIAGIVLAVLLIFGGVSIIIGAGQGNPETTAKGQKAVSTAVFGFLIIFSAYWIIRIVEIVFGLNILFIDF